MQSDGPPDAGRPDAESLEALLRDPLVRAELATVLEDAFAHRRPPTLWTRLQPWLAGAASAGVTLFVFFLPTLQEQWDRFESRAVIERYVQLGRSFQAEGRYRLADEAFGRAFELSDNQRLDIEEMRLEARVERLNADPRWGRGNPSGLRESDLLYLIHLRMGPGDTRRRAAALASYGVFLAGEGRLAESDSALQQSVRLDSTSSNALGNLGNVLSDLGRSDEAERAYRRALAADSLDAVVRYDLALLLQERGRATEAEAELRHAARLAPEDRDILRALADALAGRGDAAGAAAVRARIERLRAPAAPRDVAPAGDGHETP